MGMKKVPSEGGSGGGRGHSNMAHALYTEEIKAGARIRRRREAVRQVVEGVVDVRDATRGSRRLRPGP
jgi:hypothetical protein